jgi:hypothetical protein
VDAALDVLAAEGPLGYEQVLRLAANAEMSLCRTRPGSPLAVRSRALSAPTLIPTPAWRVFRVIMDVDVVNHTYSIEIGHWGEDTTPYTLARNDRFRTEQAAVGSLDRLGEFADSSFGTVHSCFLVLDH